MFRSEFCRKCVGRLRNTEADTCVRPYKGSPTVCTIISPPGLLYCYFGQGQLANFSGVKASPNCAKHCIPNCWGLNSGGGGRYVVTGIHGGVHRLVSEPKSLCSTNISVSHVEWPECNDFVRSAAYENSDLDGIVQLTI